MDLTMHSNRLMMNANRNLKVNTGMKSKEAEKLSSGYKINRAADNAAGLSISEKMRRQIRGLNQGSLNAQDGMSWVQIGDGSLNEVDDMLHRMNELTIKSLNGSYSDRDRAMMQDEFDQLQCEIDRITNGTKFNSKPVFDEHKTPFYQFEGNKRWYQNQIHVVSAGANDLEVEYRVKEGDAPKKVSVSVPPGEYTTQELIDEIDSAFAAAGLKKDGLVMEYSQHGTCNMNIEGGAAIDDVTGGLSYLLYDSSNGGSLGALIGTTIFPTEDSQLFISRGNNDQLSFTIENTTGKTTKSITIPQGSYSRKELIDLLNKELAGTTVTASEYGTGIKLGSNDSVISGFKGNMFKIDTGSDIYTSVFYDNVKYGDINVTPGIFSGGTVIPTDSRDEKHQSFHIDSTNQKLVLAPNQGKEVELTIPAKDYTLAEMVQTLQTLFDAHNLELKASVHPDTGVSDYVGIKITSEILGKFSEVGINEGKSTAYETLFVRHPYTKYNDDAVVDYEKNSDIQAYFWGSQSFASNTMPLTITEGVNDSFLLKLTDTGGNVSSYQIKLDKGVYADANAVCTAIDNKLNGAGALPGYKGLLKVSLSGNRILLVETGRTLHSVEVSPVATNNGYYAIWALQGETITHETASGIGGTTYPASATLNTAVGNPVVFNSGNNTMVVQLDGRNHTITFPQGSLTHAQIIDEINKQLKPGTGMGYYQFPDVNVWGTQYDKNFKLESAGYSSPNHQFYESTGSSTGGNQGTAGPTINTPAKITLQGAVVPESMVIDGTNDYFQLVVNGKVRQFKIDHGDYKRDELVQKLQTLMNQCCGVSSGEEYHGVKVSLDSDNHLVLTAGLKKGGNAEAIGESSSISCSSSSSTFLGDLHTYKSTVTVVSDYPLQDSVVIDGSNNALSFSMKVNGIMRPVDIKLTSGSYSRAGIVAEINKQLNGLGVKASLDGDKLRLTADQKGAGSELIFRSVDGGSAVKALFGELVDKYPASATLNCDMQEKITIDGTTNEITVAVNGISHTIQLDYPRDYTRQELVDQINAKLSAKGVGLKATLVGKRIHYETTAKGNTAHLFVTYGSGGSAMKAIYGGAPYSHKGVTASFSNGRLVLTRTENGGSVSVSSVNGSVFQLPDKKIEDVPTDSRNGVHSQKKAYIDGVNLQEPITIDKWNKDMSFIFCDEGVRRSVQFELDEKKYTFAELEKAIQEKIDANKIDAVSTLQGKLKVSVSAQGVRIEANAPGSKNYMEKAFCRGGFYDKVICSSEELIKESIPKDEIGTQSQDTAFVVGRKDVKNNETKIQSKINDSLSLDFTYGGKTQKISITLDAGTYNGDMLKDQIQKKLNEQLKAMGFSENLIEVGIGDVSTGISGSNDSNALNFKVSQNVVLPGNGPYVLDGVSGTAAFSVFYQTDGEIEVAYAKGNKDIGSGVEIKPGETDFSFEVEGKKYILDIPAGAYTEKELVDKVNELLTNAGAPVTAVSEEGRLKIQHTMFGERKIDNISGAAKSQIFFNQTGIDKKLDGIPIQCSNNKNDYVVLDRPVLNTVSLGINSVAITRPKYGEKALLRLKEALEKVTAVRSYFGSMENRLGYTIYNNDNRAENTTAAESRIRDTDMSKAVVANSNYNILLSAGQAVMAQARQHAGDVLKLLR